MWKHKTNIFIYWQVLFIGFPTTALSAKTKKKLSCEKFYKKKHKFDSGRISFWRVIFKKNTQKINFI